MAKEFIINQNYQKLFLNTEYLNTKVLTDQVTNFTSEMFKNTCKLKIEKIQTTAYHPESNGTLECSYEHLRNISDIM